jgi:hypothetical protein
MMAFIMPIDSPIITLILPGLQTLANAAPRSPALETLIARGGGLQRAEPMLSSSNGFRSPLERWKSQLLRSLSLSEAQFPSAAVTWYGLTGQSRSGTWIQVTPVHMSVTLDGLSLHPVQSWSARELQAIEDSVAKHCNDVGFEWQRVSDAVWLHHAAPLQVETVAAEIAYRYPLRSVQPHGPDARAINQLSTELQMLLHEHPILGTGTMAPINALWLWGNGVLPPTQSTTLPSVWSDEPYVRGVYALCGAKCNELASINLNDTAGQHSVIVARVSELRVAEDQWFSPLLDGLRRGWWREARVCWDDYQITINRHQLWRVWRRTQPIVSTLKYVASSSI